MKLHRISWLPALLMMVIIFSFSAKPAVSSDKSSMFLADKILKVYENLTDHSLQGLEREETLSLIDHIVRKCAHFTEFGILAFTVAIHFWIRKRKGFRLFAWTVAVTAAYAATDEIHQLFVPGRSVRLWDVLIDTSGAAAGACFFCILAAILLKKNHRAAVDSQY
jgi:VanZ family protein